VGYQILKGLFRLNGGQSLRSCIIMKLGWNSVVLNQGILFAIKAS